MLGTFNQAPFWIIFCSFLISCSAKTGVTSGIDPVMQRYAELEEQIQKIVAKQGPEAGISLLQNAVDHEPALADVCHGLAHVVGQAAYERDGLEKALSFERDVCGSGYIHGVIEEYLAEVKDLDAALTSLCPRNALKCFHSIGHGLMDRSRNDVPGSLVLCHRFPEARQRIQCAEGVFMENFEADPVSHPSKYLAEDDPFFPCRERSDIDEGVCAFYMPRYFLRLHPRAYRDAFAYCQTIPASARNACIKGVGDSALKQNISNPLFAEQVCDTVPEDKRHYCIEGMTSYYIVHFASSKKGAELCKTLQEANRASCRKIVEDAVEFYPR